jgi:hypothetical protein
MSIQLEVENAIGRLVNEFAREPYIFFTEADAVTRFHQLLAEEPRASRRQRTSDGHEIGLVHREYPTFFRFDKQNPEAGQKDTGSRGHYDTVVLTPRFVATHPIETVMNRRIGTGRDETIVPLEAAVEFKLDPHGWSKGRTRNAILDLGKLHLSAQDVPLRYFVLLLRYRVPRIYRWDTYWPQVREAAEAQQDVASVFAVHWIALERDVEVHWFGPWATR